MLGVNVSPNPAFIITYPFTQAQPARDPQHQQYPADGFSGSFSLSRGCQLQLQFVISGKNGPLIILCIQPDHHPCHLVQR